MSKTQQRTKVQPLVRITNKDWEAITIKRETDLKVHLKAITAVREAIIHHPAYSLEKFPAGFPIQKFCTQHRGSRSMQSEDMMVFRRALTALSTVTGLMLPKNIVLIDEMTHTLAVMLTQDAQRMATEAAGEMSPEMKADMDAAFKSMPKEDIVQRVLDGNTTYDKDPEFMASGMVYKPEDVELSSVAEFSEKTGISKEQLAH